MTEIDSVIERYFDLVTYGFQTHMKQRLVDNIARGNGSQWASLDEKDLLDRAIHNMTQFARTLREEPGAGEDVDMYLDRASAHAADVANLLMLAVIGRYHRYEREHEVAT